MRETNRSKRTGLKGIAAATATAVMAHPISAHTQALSPSGISVRVCDHANGQTVLLSNESDVARTLVAIQPFKLYTKDGTVDLRKLFEQGAVRINEHSTRTFQLSDRGEAIPHASWRALVPTHNNGQTAAKLQPVDVVSSVTGELRHACTRRHLALFA